MSNVILQEKTSFLDYAQRHVLALFPCQQGAKNPIIKWLEGSTFDRAQAAAWQSANHNLAIDCAKSGIIVIDVDASKVTPAEAWKAYTELCASWRIADDKTPMPMTHSARGGWHIPFKRPADRSATDFRGGGTLVKISDVRALAEGEEDGEVIGFKNRGYCVAPGSMLVANNGNLYYRLAPNPPDEFPETPPALLEAIAKPVIDRSKAVADSGTLKFDDAKKLYQWMADENFIDGDDAWREAGMAAKLAFGDPGLELWETLATRGGLDARSLNRWNSFASEPTVDCVTLNTLMFKAHAAAWKGQIARTDMFAALPPQIGPGMASVGSPPLQPGQAPPNLGPKMPTAEQVEAQRVAALDAMPSLFRTSKQMVTGFVAPDYLVDGVFQRRYCYSHTAQTGVGKTAQDLRLAAHVATGEPLCGLEVQKGTVLYFCGENPTDVQMRWIGLTNEMGLDPDSLDVHFTYCAHKITPEFVELVRHQVTVKQQEIACVIVDTAAAHSPAEEENSNNEQGNYARTLRSFCTLPGGPCVLILCHPTKGAEKINEMTPRGGGSFLAEMDGNVGSVKNADGSIVTSAIGKFRGPEFPPLYFALRGVTVPQLVDSKGKPVPTVIAEPISPNEVQLRETKAVSDHIKVLTSIDANPRKSLADIGTEIGWVGTPASIKGKVNRIVGGLIESKLLLRDPLTKRLVVTAEGQRSLNRLESTVSHAVSPPPPYPPK